MYTVLGTCSVSVIHPGSARNSDWLFAQGLRNYSFCICFPVALLLPSLDLAIPSWLNVLCEWELVKCFGIAGVRMALLVRPGACPAPACTVALGGALEGDDTVLATFCCPSQGIRRCDANPSGFHLLQCLLSQVPSLIKVQATSALSGGSGLLSESHLLFLTTLTWTVP